MIDVPLNMSETLPTYVWDLALFLDAGIEHQNNM